MNEIFERKMSHLYNLYTLLDFSEKTQAEVVRGTSHDHLDWPRLSYREQLKEGDEEADRGNDGKTTSKSGLTLNGTSYYGKSRTAGSGGSWL